ncbi:MAG TPA: TGS domain-containing protein [Ktedonobacteraceae bacterium]|jgi:(p)ppGpp synthase/HD superfamily hydrolase|nr:TGS domain-containing protein [Ktedonobacteraceae bacterium]
MVIQTKNDLSPWRPVWTIHPPGWDNLLYELEQEVRGLPRSPQAYVLNIRYDIQEVGKLLQSWGLPWPIVAAGYLLSYEDQLFQKRPINDLLQIQGHKREALNYMHHIEDDDLSTLLNPPYKDLGGLLIALAVYIVTLRKHAQKRGEGQSYQPEDTTQIEAAGQALLHITKRLGIWHMKRQIEDLIEQICFPQRFHEDKQEHTLILTRDAPRLDAIQQLLTNFYEETTEQSIHIEWVPCGIAGLKRRQQDAYTTATTQKSQLVGTDLVTFNITVSTVKDCYAAFGVLSQLGYIQDRVSDQIANPKPNGYSHIALNLILNARHPFFQESRWQQEQRYSCQLQITTSLMQAVMHYGCLYPTCYDLYTQTYSHENIQPKQSTRDFWQSNGDHIFASMWEDIQRITSPYRDPEKPIIVYGENRNFVALPKGATALDFAYEINIQLGEKAAEAFVNNRKVELKHVLDAGDIVEIRTAKETQVQEHWLDEAYAITPKALTHLKALLKRIHLERRGFDLIREALEQQQYTFSSEDLEEQIHQLVKTHKLGTKKFYLKQISEKSTGVHSAEWAAEQIIVTLDAKYASTVSLEYQGFDLIREALERQHYIFPLEDLDEQIHQLVKAHKLGTNKHYLRQISEKSTGVYSAEWAAQRIIATLTTKSTPVISEEPNWIPVQLVADTNPYRTLRLCAICQPTYAIHKEIVGYARRPGNDLIVHSIHCSRITRTKQYHKAFIHALTWKYNPPVFQVGFLTLALDRQGLILDITRRLRRHQCLLLTIRAEIISKLKKAELRFTIETHDIHEAFSIREEIKKIDAVNTVEFDPITTTTSIYEQLQLQPSKKGIAVQITANDILLNLGRRAPILRNLFDISRPTSGPMFFGRSEEIKILQRELCEEARGRAILLYGPRRSGKSSLCKNFLDRYTPPSCCTVLTSLQGAGHQTEAEILEHIATEICAAFQEQHQLSVPAWQELPGSDPEQRFRYLITHYLHQQPHLRLIVALDEFGGVLQAYEAGILQLRFFIYWRGLISTLSQLSLILVIPSSSHKLISQRDLANAFSFAQPLALNYLDQKSAERLLVDPLREQHIALHPNVPIRAIELTGGNPYYMTLLGLQIITQLNREPHKQLITEEDLHNIVEHIMNASSAQNFLFYREELQSEDEQCVLEAIVELTSHTNQSNISRKQLAVHLQCSGKVIIAALQRLRTGLILQEFKGDSQNPYYTFKIALVWYWMKRNRWFFTL